MHQTPIHFMLRPATNDDVEFIFQLRIATMKPWFETTFGWDAIEEYRKAAHRLADAQIVTVDGKDIGVIKTNHSEHALHLHQMQIHPEFQNRGLGAELIRLTIERAEALQVPITLAVVTTSPARRLYERFGFVTTHEHEHHSEMCRKPCQSDTDVA